MKGKRYGPNNTIVDAVLGNTQLMQLAWWQEQADNWPVYFSHAGVRLIFMCKACERQIMDVTGYKLGLVDLTSQTVAHLRQFHRELGADGREDSKVGNRDDLAGSGDGVRDSPSGHEA